MVKMLPAMMIKDSRMAADKITTMAVLYMIVILNWSGSQLKVFRCTSSIEFSLIGLRIAKPLAPKWNHQSVSCYLSLELGRLYHRRIQCQGSIVLCYGSYSPSEENILQLPIELRDETFNLHHTKQFASATQKKRSNNFFVTRLW